eukprot:ctg_3596.g573
MRCISGVLVEKDSDRSRARVPSLALDRRALGSRERRQPYNPIPLTQFSAPLHSSRPFSRPLSEKETLLAAGSNPRPSGRHECAWRRESQTSESSLCDRSGLPTVARDSNC